MQWPQIFDGTKFIEPDPTGLPPEGLNALAAVRASWNELQTAELAVSVAQENVTAALEAVAASEAAVQKFYRHDIHSPAGRSEREHLLWKQIKGI